MIFVTGGTGYLGSYVVDHLLRHSELRLALLTRATSRQQADEKLWQAMQLHMDVERFRAVVADRIDYVFGDLTAPDLGIAPDTYRKLVHGCDSVLHIAASLNRKSSKSCFNHNLRGTLSVLKLARAAQDHHGLRRFSYVSTVAVAGHRQSEIVEEDTAIDWQRSDYDPYAQTKKFCEHMVHELLGDVPRTIFRPSIVMGDSRRPETTQFDMVRAFCLLADLPALPLSPAGRLDIVPADFVGAAIAAVHLRSRPQFDTYHLSAGEASPTAGEIARAFATVGVTTGGRPRRSLRFLPALSAPFGGLINTLAALPRRNAVTQAATLLKVFWPYVTYDTVFDNRRIVAELGAAPTRFTDYCAGLYAFAKRVGFVYPYRALPVQETPEKRRQAAVWPEAVAAAAAAAAASGKGTTSGLWIGRGGV